MMFPHLSSLCSICRHIVHPHKTAGSFHLLRCLSQSSANVRRNVQTHYEVLGLSPFASQAEIRGAFLQLSKQLHPDVNPGDPHNHVKFVQINEAYSVLNNRSSRREYDFWLEHSSRLRAARQSQTSQSQTHSGKTDWDKAYYYNRARNAEAFYHDDHDDAYYGIKGLRRQSNGAVAGACCVLILLGWVYFYVAFKYSVRKCEMSMQASRENVRVLREVQHRARTHSMTEQLQRMIELSRSSQIKQNLDSTNPKS